MTQPIQKQQKLDDLKATLGEECLKSITSKIGMSLMTKDAGPRNTIDQSDFKQALIHAYSPRSKRHLVRYRWDPVVGDLLEEVQCAHLFPYSQGTFMDYVFGKGSQKEPLSYRNGLLLYVDIKIALENGFVAIVPDIDLEPANPSLPLNDKEERDQRIRTWQKSKKKEYKFIVLNKKHPSVTEPILPPRYGVPSIAALDGKQLQFLTDKRPRYRYVWWTYLYAIVRNSWSQKLAEVNLQHQEVQKRTLHWGGSYIKRNQLLGLIKVIEEIGLDVEIEFNREEVDVKPRLEAFSALLGHALVQLHEEEEDDWETDDESEGEDEREKDEQ
ncbi:hypothetical protein ACHAPO_010240 [Fusarium lateritium]